MKTMLFSLVALWSSATIVAAQAPAKAPAATPPAAAPTTPTPSVASGPKHELRYRFTLGESIRTRITHISAIQTTIKGASETATSHSTSTKLWKVSAVHATSGQATIDYSVEQVHMRRRVGDHEQAYDSRRDTVPPDAYKKVAQTVGVPLATLTLDPRGAVVKREAKQDSAATSNSAVTLPLPANPVAVGESWDERLTLTAILEGGRGQQVAARHRYTLKSVENGIATISIQTHILDPGLSAKVEVQLIQHLIQGEAKLDVAKGRLLSQRLKVDGSVVDFHGPGSLMKCVIEVQEELLPADATTAQTSQPATTKK